MFPEQLLDPALVQRVILLGYGTSSWGRAVSIIQVRYELLVLLCVIQLIKDLPLVLLLSLAATDGSGELVLHFVELDLLIVLGVNFDRHAIDLAHKTLHIPTSNQGELDYVSVGHRPLGLGGRDVLTCSSLLLDFNVESLERVLERLMQIVLRSFIADLGDVLFIGQT